MPFKKGDPNINRAGRPKKGNTISDILKEVMQTKREYTLPDGTIEMRKVQDVLIERWLSFSMSEYQALVKIMEFAHGKPDVYKVVDSNVTMPIPDIIIEQYSTVKEEGEECQESI